jgi:hypothetical protein
MALPSGMAIQRPPRDITPTDYFCSWLPGQYGDWASQIAAGGVGDRPIDVAVSGDGGGQWSLRATPGGLDVATGPGENPVLELAITVADWRALVAGEGDTPALVPDEIEISKFVDNLNPALLNTAAQARGRLVMRVAGCNGRTWEATATFGATGNPEATFTTDLETVLAMRSGSLLPAQAYFTGKIALKGDANFALQLGMALLAHIQ